MEVFYVINHAERRLEVVPVPEGLNTEDVDEVENFMHRDMKYGKDIDYIVSDPIRDAATTPVMVQLDSRGEKIETHVPFPQHIDEMTCK